jgi:hypothetical protein
MILPGKSFFSPPKPKPLVLPPVPTIDSDAVRRAREDERLSARRRRQRSDTILTSGLGDVSEPTLARPSLG